MMNIIQIKSITKCKKKSGERIFILNFNLANFLMTIFLHTFEYLFWKEDVVSELKQLTEMDLKSEFICYSKGRK